MGSCLRRFCFRFASAYAVLYVLPFPLRILPFRIPGISWLVAQYSEAWSPLVAWLGHAVFHLTEPISRHPTGSGDTAFDYLKSVAMLGLAAAGGLVWAFFDRNRRGDRWVRELVRIDLRYYLAGVYLTYGFAKLTHSQFPIALPEYLVERYGQSSPMRLLWAFMGYSPVFSAFTGGAEALAGTLMFFRRTATLGAVIGITMMVNIVMLNFCFDVPVKLYSSHLLVFTFVVLWPDLVRLTNVFILNRATGPANLAPLWLPVQWARIAARVAQMVAIAAIVYGHVAGSILRPTAPPKLALQGVYEVQSFVRDGTLVPPHSDPKRWEWVTFNGSDGIMDVHLADESQRVYMAGLNTAGTALTLSRPWLTFKQASKAGLPLVLQCTRPSADEVILKGSFNSNPLTIALNRADLLLLNRGFHWINEYPFNR